MFFLLIVFFGVNASALSVFDDVINAHSSKGIYNECSLVYDDNLQNTSIAVESPSRPSMSLIFTEKTIHVDGSTYFFEESDYDGKRSALFVERPNKLIVTLMWTDNDNGADKSTFCELPRK